VRPRKAKNGTEVAHVTRDSDTTFKVKRSKVKVTGGAAYCGGLPHSLFPTRRKLQPPTFSFIVIIVVTDPPTVPFRWPASRLWPSLEQSAARRHISSDSRCFPESTQNLPVLPFVLALTDAYTPFSGLAVFYLGHYR